MKTVRLLKEHWQAGVKYEAGQEIEMSDEDAEWYVGAIVAEREGIRVSHERLKERLGIRDAG